MLDPRHAADLHKVTALPPRSVVITEPGPAADQAGWTALRTGGPSLRLAGPGAGSRRFSPALQPTRPEVPIVDLCRGTLGITNIARLSHTDVHLRAAPSAGNCHPVQLYVIVQAPPGATLLSYFFDPVIGSLRGDPAQDEDGKSDRLGSEAVTSVAFVFSAVPTRSTDRYGPPGLRYSIWDTGSAVGNLAVLLRQQQLGFSVFAAFDERAIGSLLRVDRSRELPLAVVTAYTPGHQLAAPTVNGALGPGCAGAAPDDSAENGGTRERPGAAAADWLRRLVVGDPAMVSHADRSRWRSWARAVATERRTATAQTRRFIADSRLMDAIPRSGAVRLLRRDPVNRSALARVLRCSERVLPLDYAPAEAGHLRVGVALHAVEGEPPGYHSVAGARLSALGLGAEAQVRARTRAICLGQALAEDAAFVVFFFASLGAFPVPDAPCLYKGLLMEAAGRAQEMRLAGTACGLASSPLAFLDDQAEHALPGCGNCLFAVAFGYRDHVDAPAGRGYELTLREMMRRNTLSSQ